MSKRAEFKTTTNSSLERKLKKDDLANRFLIHCHFCPYHKNENAHGVRRPKDDRHKNHRRKK